MNNTFTPAPVRTQTFQIGDRLDIAKGAFAGQVGIVRAVHIQRRAWAGKIVDTTAYSLILEDGRRTLMPWHWLAVW